MASLVETAVRAYYGPEAVAKGLPSPRAFREGYSMGAHRADYSGYNKKTRKTFDKLPLGAVRTRSGKAGYIAAMPEALVRENPVAAGVALGTGVTGAGGSVLVARRKKG